LLGSTLIPTTPVTAYPAAVNANIGEQAPSVKSKSPVFQSPSFGARVSGSPSQPSVNPGTPIRSFTFSHQAPHKMYFNETRRVAPGSVALRKSGNRNWRCEWSGTKCIPDRYRIQL
jgi:hypothetical protein